ncbi:MAG TPA: diguanylate cyclase [Candidatus Ozemobacteraceae bacterium]|nr:diguanylate cyclase [Candidatus Ozemobacteraceae bacterium]
MKLKWKMSLIFGILGACSAALAGYIVFRTAMEQFERSMIDELRAVAEVSRRIVDPKRLETIHSVNDAYYVEIKSMMRSMQEHFNLDWFAIYRYNGKYFTHIVDGSDMGDEFVPDYPILDISDEMLAAWEEAKPSYSAANIDAFGMWASSYVPITNASSTVVGLLDVSRNNDVLLRFIRKATLDTLYVMLLIGLVTLAVCFIFSKYLTLSIDRLIKGTQELAAGNFEHRVSGIHSRDEIGILAGTFNEMTGQLATNRAALERKIFEVTTLYEISQQINYANSAREIQQLILKKCIEGLKAGRGSVLLFNEETGKLIVDVAVGEGVEPISKRIEFAPGEGVAGRVFEDQKLLLDNNPSEPNFKPYPGETGTMIRNIMCLPLLVEKRSIGVMNIVNKRDEGFTEADTAFAGTMASQIALTIEKARLYELSITDGLTKLFVHRYFQVALDNELKRAKRYGSCVSLILLDIDHFKQFNDAYGHQMGDRVLSLTALILREAIRSIDVPCRYGGEEFVVVLPETDAQNTLGVAERIRKTVEAYDYPGLDGGFLKVTVSLGIASFPEHGTEKMDLIKRADEAMYWSKEAGRNRVSIWSPTGRPC